MKTISNQNLGIQHLVALHRIVPDLEEERRLFVDVMGFDEIARSGPELEAQTRERSLLLEADECRIVCTQPLAPDSRAARFLRRHPAGIGALSFAVDDAERAYQCLDARGGTPTAGVTRTSSRAGQHRSFSITTPVDDVEFQFVEQRGDAAPLPGFVETSGGIRGGNHLRIRRFDHITGNFRTLAPISLWFEHVLGFERYWDIEFHLQSGLRSVVMWDPRSGIKFACNEPLQPNFQGSQVYSFCEDQGGSGIQHAALLLDDIVASVRALRQAGARFTPSADHYYEDLRNRPELFGIAEDPETLRQLGILVDGSGARSYLLQVFMANMADIAGDAQKGPFFFELIQRKGHAGFGEGNFRALFEGIEAAQAGKGA